MVLLRRIFLYLIPAICLYYGADKMDDLIYGYPKHNATAEIFCYILGLVVINVFVPYSAEKTKSKLKEQDALIGLLLKDLRDSLNDELEHKLSVTGLELNIRIFSPKRSFWAWVKRMWSGERIFYLNDHPNLCKEQIEKLSFRVHPNPEGLVGKVFADKYMLYDSLLDDERSKNEYQLKPHHTSATADTKFVIAAPIFKDGSNDKINAIVSFDSKKRVTLPENKDWETAIRDSCKIMHKCIPFICKKH